MRLLRRMIRLLVVGRANGLRRRVLRVITRGRARAAEPAPAPVEPAPAPVAPAPVDLDGWSDVASRDELERSPLLEVRLGDLPVALALVDGQVHAVSGACLHAGGPLADGSLDGRALTCPYHGWAYDVTTGRCLVDDGLVLARFEVRESGGRIRIRPLSPGAAGEVPAAAAALG